MQSEEHKAGRGGVSRDEGERRREGSPETEKALPLTRPLHC